MKLPRKPAGNPAFSSSSKPTSNIQRRRLASTLLKQNYRPLRLLVIIENPTNLTIVTSMLTSLKMKSDQVDNAPDALHLLMSRSYDVVFMERSMREMNGLEIATWLRSSPGCLNHRTPIVELSAVDTWQDADRRKAAGIQDALGNHIHIEDLAAIINKWIQIEPTS